MTTAITRLDLYIALTGGAAIWLTQDPDPDLARWACLVGLASQPGFLHQNWQAKQWGQLSLAIFYTYAWARGVWVFWL